MQDHQAAEVLKRVAGAITREAELDPHAHALQLQFSNGVLTIEGEVDGVRRKRLVLNAVEGVPEVRKVIDRLHVHRSARPGDGATRDMAANWMLADINFQNCAILVRTNGRSEILRTPGLDASGSIEIDVADGVVSLRGHVISLSHKRLAGAFAWWSHGCRDVVNLLQIVPGEEDNDDEIVDALRLVLECDPGVRADQISIACRDAVVTLDGEVASDTERRRAEDDAWCLFGVRQVVDRIEVS